MTDEENNTQNVWKEHDDGKLFAFASVVFGVVAIGCMLISCAIGPLFAIAGIVIGFFGSFISIRKYLKMEGNEILGW